ncbi:MAG: sigma-70 family RNA polymerase sigma factor [Pseudomonadota bacterium]
MTTRTPQNADLKRAKAKTAQQAAFKALYQEHAAALKKGVRARYGDGPPEPDDVVQEAFRRFFDLDNWRAIKNVRAFLWRTACNFVLSTKTSSGLKDKYRPELESIFRADERDISTPETVISLREQLEAINALLAAMPKRRRLAFLLYRIDGLTQMQISRRLNLSRSAVQKDITLAEAAIADLFLNDGEV